MPEIFFNGRPFLLSDGQAVAGVDAEQKKKLRQAGAVFPMSSRLSRYAE